MSGYVREGSCPHHAVACSWCVSRDRRKLGKLVLLAVVYVVLLVSQLAVCGIFNFLVE